MSVYTILFLSLCEKQLIENCCFFFEVHFNPEEKICTCKTQIGVLCHSHQISIQRPWLLCEELKLHFPADFALFAAIMTKIVFGT